MKLVRKLKKKKLEVTKLKRYQNLFRTISIRKDLQSLKVEGSMDKQKADALVIDEAAIWEDIDDYIHENNVENVLSIEDEKRS